MATTSVARKGSTPTLALVDETPGPLRYHDVMIAISKARAARCLLVIKTSGSDYMQIPTNDDHDEVRAWIEDFAFRALDTALDEADAAFRKVHAESIAPAKAVAS